MPVFAASDHHVVALATGVSLGCSILGSGPPVLLWHGFLGNRAAWRHVASMLQDRYTVIVPDMRGYGSSSRPATGYDGLSLMSDCRALLRHLGYRETHIIAHDMGAAPALLWAATHPGEVLSLSYVEEPLLTSDVVGTLIRMTPEEARNGGLWWWMLAYASDMAERLISGHERAFVDWFYDSYAAAPDRIDNEARECYASDLMQPGGIRGWFGVYRAVFETIRQTESALRVPVETPILALGGEHSLGSRVGDMLRPIGRDVEVGVIPGSGHFVPEEKPHELCRRWLEFVQRHQMEIA